MTGSDYIQSALQKIKILAEGETPSAEQGADMLALFNGMMENLRGQGVDLGFAPLSGTTDTVDLQEGYREIIKCMLAIQASSLFEVPDGEIPQIVIKTATDGHNRMLREAIYREQIPRDFDHLPFRTGLRVNIEKG